MKYVNTILLVSFSWIRGYLWMQPRCCCFSLLHLSFPGGRLADMHIEVWQLLDSLKGAIWKVCQVGFMNALFFVKIQNNKESLTSILLFVQWNVLLMTFKLYSNYSNGQPCVLSKARDQIQRAPLCPNSKWNIVFLCSWQQYCFYWKVVPIIFMCISNSICV